MATELPRNEAVRAAPDTQALRVDVRDEKSREQLARDKLLQDFIQNKSRIDPRTREVVFQAVNIRTGEIVRQFPDDIMLRLRDYVNFMAEAREKSGEPERKVGRIA